MLAPLVQFAHWPHAGLSFPLQMSHKQPILLAVMISRKPAWQGYQLSTIAQLVSDIAKQALRLLEKCGRGNPIFSQSPH
ncbi:hypothetical protein CV016_13715 [Yersinia kristensenii]|nr:hypothetical protein CV016_13715 [Yersinia kristensenii]